MSERPSPGARRPGPIPARAGIGLRAAHHADFRAQRPAVAWLEVHSENFFADGGAQLDCLLDIRADYPVSLHGVGLSLGSVDPLDTDHLAKLARLIRRCQPALVSEHLAWGSINGTHLNDLLPLPYTAEALRHMIARVDQLQEALDRQVLIENVSSYLQFADSDIPEWEFIAALARATGCGLLVDVNNIFVSACNHEFDARGYLRALPPRSVREIHLAGHTLTSVEGRELRIDTHSAPVCDAVWQLYRDALELYGEVPTLIEWDAELPPLADLIAEADKANHILENRHALAA